METKTVYRLFAEWSFDKEEEWLNSMAQEGWTLKKVGFCKNEGIPFFRYARLK